MTPSPDYDVIIAGAGPAGSMAAASLSRAGWKVLLLEKKTFPRSKPCGGCLSRRVEGLLPPVLLQEVIEKEITRVIFTFKQRETLEFTTTQPAAYMVRREFFDFRLAREARQAGAEIRFSTPLSSYEILPEFVSVQTPAGRFKGRFLVLASGAYFAERLNQRARPTSLTYQALEGPVASSGVSAPWPPEAVAIHLGSVAFGYGWTFPSGKRLSIGVSYWPAKENRPRRCRDQFLRGLSFLETRPRLKGHPIPCYDGQPVAYAQKRVLRAGDAARLVEPFLGEGIYYALWSGQRGAEVISSALQSGNPDLSAYPRALARELLPEFARALRLARWFYAWPGLFWWLLKKHDSIMPIYFNILRGQESYDRFFWEFKKKIRKYTGLRWVLGEPRRRVFP
ncbi:MAG: geranylgeranyl reductase family protein [Desulfobacterota bacterium]|nr:geranylgeranyl reductase family protein [Thermodesulfobacteriota bacterium]